MSLSRVTTWQIGDVLTAANLNAEFDNIKNNASALISPALDDFDLNSHVLIDAIHSHTAVTFAAGDTTPSVAGGTVFKTSNTAPTTISFFDSGFDGQLIWVVINDANTTIDFSGTNLEGNAELDWSPTTGDSLQAVFVNPKWYCRVSGTPTSSAITIAGTTSVTATGANTARTLANWFADEINVAGYSANQTGYEEAVADAYAAGKTVYWPYGTYVSTATIPNFHDVRHRGPGVVQRGSSLFYVEPTQTQANAIYVATTGSNSNDGLSSSQPTLTIQKAIDYLKPYAPLSGAWTITIAAGTYAEAVLLPDHTSFSGSYLTIKGPSVATVQTDPTVIIDYPGSGTTGLDLGQHNKVKVMDIKFTDWKSPAVTGLNADDNSVLWAYNVHASYCRQGIVANAARLYVQGGILHGVDWTTGAFPTGGGSVGIVAYAGTTASIGYGGTDAASGTIIENFAQAGYEGKSKTHVVSTWVTYRSNEVAVWVYSDSRFDDRHNIYKKNELVFLTQKGFIARDSVLGLSEYNFGATYAQAPSDAGDGNFEIFDFFQYSVEEVFAHPDAIGGLDITKQRQSTLQTGTIASTLTRTLATIYAGTLQSGTGTNGKYLEVFLCGATTLATNTKTVVLKLGGATITTLTIATGTQTWTAHVTIWASNATSVIQITEATNATITAIRAAAATIDAWADNDLEVWTAIPGAADTATLHECRVVKWG